MHRHAGFTLFELLIAVSIITILTTIAVPTFGYLNNRRVSQTQVENLQRALNMARQNAIASNRQTIICPSANGGGCDSTNEWSYGFLVYENRDNDSDYSSADRILEYVPGVLNVAGRQGSGGLAQRLTSSISHGAAFSPQGFTSSLQTFTFCDSNQRQAFIIKLAKTGRAKLEAGSNASC